MKELFRVVHATFYTETCTGKESFEQARISTYHFYIRHIRATINFHTLALERGGQSTCSSPEVCLQKASRNLTRISRHFWKQSPGNPGRLKRPRKAWNWYKDEKFCKWNTNFHWDVPTGKTGLPFEQFHFFWEFSSRANRKNVFHLAPNRNFRNFWLNGKHPTCQRRTQAKRAEHRFLFLINGGVFLYFVLA